MRGKFLALGSAIIITAVGCGSLYGKTATEDVQREDIEFTPFTAVIRTPSSETVAEAPIVDAPVTLQEPRRAEITQQVDSDTLTPKQRAKRYARRHLSDIQYSCLDEIFSRESSWRRHAGQPYSGPYGIPQALPGSKMDVIDDDWKHNSVTQVRWGIRYVNGRYGSACKAWYFWQRNHWY